MIVNNKYVIVIHESGEHHVSEFFESARIETLQEMIVVDSLSKLDIKKLPLLKEGEEKETMKIYSIDGKAVCDHKLIKTLNEKTI